MLELVVSRSGKELVALPVEREEFRIGRAGTNDLSLPDPTVSRHQCEIVFSGGKARLEDKSGNGTSVDGKLVRDGEIGPGSRIEFGSLAVMLRERAEEAPAAGTTLAGGATEVLPGAEAEGRGLLLAGEDVRFALKGGTVGIGSDPGNQIVIKDSFTSAFHCRLFSKGRDWFVTDLDSTNGTYINDVKITEAQLRPGAALTVGRVRLRVEDQEGGQPGLSGIVAEDPVMQPVFEMIRRAAPTDETVLVTGESGSGKELVARAIHALSRRASRSMVALNCSAITRELMESELFGHEKGAFTGAQSRRKGLFEEADSGTLFLDEIGELALDLQAKLLRTLENGEVRRVGSNTPVRVDVRVIAATHRSLPERVQVGDFREDLYYRINVLEIPLPPLRKRPKDIPVLAEHFLKQTTGGVGPRKLAESAVKRLCGYHFPRKRPRAQARHHPRGDHVPPGDHRSQAPGLLPPHPGRPGLRIRDLPQGQDPARRGDRSHPPGAEVQPGQSESRRPPSGHRPQHPDSQDGKIRHPIPPAAGFGVKWVA